MVTSRCGVSVAAVARCFIVTWCGLIAISPSYADEAPARSGGTWGAVFRAIGRAIGGKSDEEFVLEQTAADASDKRSATAPVGSHRQVGRIRVDDAGDSLKLASFCLTPDQQLITLTAAGVDNHGISQGSLDAKTPGGEVQIRNLEGEIQTRFKIEFPGSAINAGPDGMIYVGGHGRVAKFDREGRLVCAAESPNLAGVNRDDEALTARARETVEEQATSIRQTVQQFKDQAAELAKKNDSELTDEERQLKIAVESNSKIYEQMLKQYAEPSEAQIEETKQYLRQRQGMIHAITANDHYVFVTCAAKKGYGYSVWRTDLQFEHPQLIVDGLRGCCGQMDVQCCDDELVVAENSRHRVVRFDSSGKETLAFGKRSRDGEGDGFGSCCNPMNTRQVGDTLYVAESDGTVKRFSKTGDFIDVVGRADVEPGCKSSIVAATNDGQHVFYFDVEHSAICVLKPATTASK